MFSKTGGVLTLEFKFTLVLRLKLKFRYSLGLINAISTEIVRRLRIRLGNLIWLQQMLLEYRESFCFPRSYRISPSNFHVSFRSWKKEILVGTWSVHMDYRNRRYLVRIFPSLRFPFPALLDVIETFLHASFPLRAFPMYRVLVLAISCGARACISEQRETCTRPCAWQRTRISELRTTFHACIAPVLADVLMNQRIRTGEKMKIRNFETRDVNETCLNMEQILKFYLIICLWKSAATSFSRVLLYQIVNRQCFVKYLTFERWIKGVCNYCIYNIESQEKGKNFRTWSFQVRKAQ